jgi:hypothetical protein
MVREALVTSVACTAPPVSFQISQLSMVPNSELAARGAGARAFHMISSHSSLVAEK